MDGVQFVTARGWEDLSAYLQAADTLGLPVDEGVIAQYLRHPEVSRDFAAYWVLYRKYHQTTVSRIFCRASRLTPWLPARWMPLR